MTTVVVTGPATEVRLQVCGLLHLAESWWVSLTEYNPAGMLKRVENLLQHLWNQANGVAFQALSNAGTFTISFANNASATDVACWIKFSDRKRPRMEEYSDPDSSSHWTTAIVSPFSTITAAEVLTRKGSLKIASGSRITTLAVTTFLIEALVVGTCRAIEFNIPKPSAVAFTPAVETNVCKEATPNPPRDFGVISFIAISAAPMVFNSLGTHRLITLSMPS
ncbi:MAG: hypothetical protein CYPHOPRED_004811, partial [Cyphobasidiales sp. Tagirdzhanova-0007]